MKAALIASILLITYISAQQVITPKVITTPEKVESWTIEYDHKSHPGAPPTIPSDAIPSRIYDGSVPKTKSVYIVSKKVSLRSVHHIGGTKQDFYYYKNYEYCQLPMQKDANSILITTEPEEQFRVKIPGVHWVMPEFYNGKRILNGKECFYFADSESKKERAELENEIGHLDFKPTLREAWFDTKTGLPVMYKIGELVGRYTFDTAAKEKIIVPEAIKNEIHQVFRYEEYNRRAKEPGKLAPY